MFYSQFILAKKGPLGTIWIAAHLERKLRKNQVADTDIGVSVDSILFPEMPIALRLSSHLLLGVVRIYSRKVNYLFDDCSEALLKVKQAFRSTAVDLPPEESTAPYHSITLPETFDLDDFELPDNEILQGNVDHHISSRDQITLQDTMEGVLYSTSKFGLDERFGDGDTSGLDLDEDLLVEKAPIEEHATATLNSDVDPQASVQAPEPPKYDGNQDVPTGSEAMQAGGGINQMEEYDGDNEPVEYAQAPCTPGLWEEPNLSNIQETSAYDDHQEQENHNVTESVVKETTYLPHQQEHSRFVPHEKPLPDVSKEHVSVDVLDSTPLPNSTVADQVRSTSPKADAPYTVVSAPKDREKVEDLRHEYARDSGPGVQFFNDNRENRVEFQGNREDTCHLTVELESNTEPFGKENLDNPKDEAIQEPKDSIQEPKETVEEPKDSIQEPKDSIQEPKETIQQPKDSIQEPKETIQELKETIQEPKDSIQEPKDSHSPILSVDYSMPTSDIPVLKPCVTHLSQSEANEKQHPDRFQPSDFASFHSFETSVREEHPSVSSYPMLVQGQRNLPETHVAEPVRHEVQVVSNVSNGQVDSVIQRNFESRNMNSYTLDFSAPEKLLSLPQSTSGVPKNSLLETTPTEAHTARGDTGSYVHTGKKRSHTESSLTAQSFNLAQSSGLFTTNVTANSAVGGDDMLSSILVGRKSSTIKMKPTPPPELSSRKRRRSAPRTGVTKRKVVMDDNMVLHGDTIRQQLTSTEDIRRLRKKAPCTRSEISMIQKQLWEDELFSEAIFTGMSTKLTSLHNQSYDLSKIKVLAGEASYEGGTNTKPIPQNDENIMQRETGTENTGVLVGSNVPQRNEGEANFYPVASKDVYEAQPVTENQPCDDNTTSLYHHDGQTPMHAASNVAEPFGSEHELSGQRIPMEIDGQTFLGADTGISTIPTEVEPPPNVVPGFMPAALGQVENTTETGGFMQMDALGQVEKTSEPGGFLQMESLGQLEKTTETDGSLQMDALGQVEKTSEPGGFLQMQSLGQLENTTETGGSLQMGALGQVEKTSEPGGFLQMESLGQLENTTETGGFLQMDALGQVEKTTESGGSLQIGAPGQVEKTSDTLGSLQMDAPGIQSDGTMNLQSVDRDSLGSNGTEHKPPVGVENQTGVKDSVGFVDCLEHNQTTNPFATLSSDNNGLERHIVTLDEEVVVNEDAALVSNGVSAEELGTVTAYDAQGLKDDSLDDGKSTDLHGTYPMTMTDTEDIHANNRVDGDELDYSPVENDTDFLNFDADDDDDDAEAAGDDYMPDADATRFIDNSGWSSRTKAVAKYLQIMFDKEGERGRTVLSVNNLLTGKTRKEASRMFFETLVLKTKDYIHVEQSDPFENINILPRSKLLKSDF